MKKGKEIKVRVTEKERDRLKEAAKQEGKTLSDYIRLRLKEDITEKWIKKETVQQCLSDVACVLDKYEEGNMRVVDSIREEWSKLWNELW